MKKSIRQLRHEKGITQFDLAVATNVSLISISNWERMKFRPMPHYLERLAEVLGVNSDDILVLESKTPEQRRGVPVFKEADATASVNTAGGDHDEQ